MICSMYVEVCSCNIRQLDESSVISTSEYRLLLYTEEKTSIHRANAFQSRSSNIVVQNVWCMLTKLPICNFIRHYHVRFSYLFIS